MDSNEKASQGPLLLRLGIVMTILPTLAIFFRLWSRIITTANTKLWWDDWFALLAWVSFFIAKLNILMVNIS